MLVICTGNVARSVMAGAMLEHLAGAHGLDVTVTTAGILAVEGQRASMRTRAALAAVTGLPAASVGGHRSCQLTGDHLRDADLVVAMELDHVRYVRRKHPGAAARTATLRRLAAQLEPAGTPLADRVASLRLAAAPLDPAEEVADPAGQPDEAYVECARELWSLCSQVAPRLAP
ncbi:MAG TPA: hypothetical protein VKV25_02570 [Acidimicrobiales bacterium]|nr:hypothetical protein [Acidimicrobiales bacterium]